MATLAERIEAAAKGCPALSSEVFRALGGELRREPVSKQSPELYSFAYWPGDKDPIMGVSFTTNVGDILHEVRRRAWGWRLSEADGRVAASVGGSRAVAADPALALCAAAVRLLGAA